MQYMFHAFLSRTPATGPPARGPQNHQSRHNVSLCDPSDQLPEPPAPAADEGETDPAAQATRVTGRQDRESVWNRVNLKLQRRTRSSRVIRKKLRYLMYCAQCATGI